jgi:hypothetical protein
MDREHVVLWTFAIASVLIFAVSLYLGMPWWGAIISGVGLSGLLAGWLGDLNEWIPPVPAVYKTVTENVEVGRRKSCIACKQAVEHIR